MKEKYTIPPCPFCGESRQSYLVLEPCAFDDSYYIKCDQCGACGPVGYPDEEYDACDYDACDRACEEAKGKAISLWAEINTEKECLRRELVAMQARAEKAERERDALTEMA